MDGKVIEMQGFLKCPANTMIVSPSFSGKTSLAIELLKHRDHIFSEKVHGIVICYSMKQEIYNTLKGDIILHEGVPTYNNFKQWKEKFNHQHFLCLLDDLLNEMLSKENLQQTEAIFTRLGHHFNMSVLTLSQNLFWKNMRLISLNNHYFFLLKFVRDKSQLQFFGRQLFLGNGCQKFINIYNDAMETSKSDVLPSYLLIKTHPFDDKFQFFTNILPHQNPPVLYIMD